MKHTRVFLFIAAFSVMAGCSGGADELSAKDDASFKNSLASGKEKLDPNNVPPEVRERVKGFMQANKPPAKK